MLPMCQNTTMCVNGAWIKRYYFLCSKTYNTLHSFHNFMASLRQAAREARICETSLLILKHFLWDCPLVISQHLKGWFVISSHDLVYQWRYGWRYESLRQGQINPLCNWIPVFTQWLSVETIVLCVMILTSIILLTFCSLSWQKALKMGDYAYLFSTDRWFLEG